MSPGKTNFPDKSTVEEMRALAGIFKGEEAVAML
jgi:hypothetical protein